MQTVHAVQSPLRIADAAETGLEAALRHLDETSPDGTHRTVAHLAAACAAAQRELAGIAQGKGALSWPQFARAMRIDEQVQACYARAGRSMLSATPLAEPLPNELIHASAQLLRDLSAVYAREVVEPGSISPAEEEGRDPALRLTRALWCLGASAKWMYFMHVGSDATLWRACHALYLRAESLGIAHREVCLYRDPELGALTCADIYVHTLLLGMLNAGNLSAQQIELAHRWVMTFVRNAGVDTSVDGAAHVFHVRLDSERGLEAGIPPGGASAAVRFVDIEPVCARLIDSRESLRKGKVDLGDVALQSVVLDYGAFLDLAERFWSPGVNQVQERAPRLDETPQAIDVAVGFDRLIDAVSGRLAAQAGARHQARETADSGGNIAFLYPDTAGQPAGMLTCTLQDCSDTGVGLLMPGGSTAPPIGALIGFRSPRSGRWEVGMLVRRLAAPEASQTLLGIKGFSDHPIVVMLQHAKPAAAATASVPAESPAIFAPMDGRRSRVDSLILLDATYSRGKDFMVPAGDTKFCVRLNRVLDRGNGWLRAGYQVLSKK